jgi:hypothetical protein
MPADEYVWRETGSNAFAAYALTRASQSPLGDQLGVDSILLVKWHAFWNKLHLLAGIGANRFLMKFAALICGFALCDIAIGWAGCSGGVRS